MPRRDFNDSLKDYTLFFPTDHIVSILVLQHASSHQEWWSSGLHPNVILLIPRVIFFNVKPSRCFPIGLYNVLHSSSIHSCNAKNFICPTKRINSQLLPLSNYAIILHQSLELSLSTLQLLHPLLSGHIAYF